MLSVIKTFEFFFIVWITLLTVINNTLGENTTHYKNFTFSSNSHNLRQSSFFEWLGSLFQPSATSTSIVNITTPSSKPRECMPCTCGTANTITRIVGGQETQINQYPWMVMLKLRGRFYCGGTLINDLYIVSAAHCLHGFPTVLVSVRLMEHNRRNSSINVIDRKVERVYVHKKYSTRNLDNDIALLKLTEPVKFTDKLRPVCMAHEHKSYDHEEAIITGWGAISEGGSLADVLQEVRVPILSQEECQNSTYGSVRITENMLCAGHPQGGKDSCQGDSGGPLHIVNKDTDTYHLAGIVSWGEGCGRPNFPGVFTRVNKFLSWIEEKTKDGCMCPTKNFKKH